jgi:hypothetical protein
MLGRTRYAERGHAPGAARRRLLARKACRGRRAQQGGETSRNGPGLSAYLDASCVTTCASGGHVSRRRPGGCKGRGLGRDTPRGRPYGRDATADRGLSASYSGRRPPFRSGLSAPSLPSRACGEGRNHGPGVSPHALGERNADLGGVMDTPAILDSPPHGTIRVLRRLFQTGLTQQG